MHAAIKIFQSLLPDTVHHLLSPRRKAEGLRSGAIFLFAYANYVNYSFVCLSPTRTCRAMA